MSTTNGKLETIKSSIHARWKIPNWPKRFPWWRAPAQVRLLLYADGPVQFSGGPFLGLDYVIELLRARPYPYVDFVVSTAHRTNPNAGATIPGAKALTDLALMNDFDEVWFFGFDSTPNLSADEVTLLEQFVAAPKSGGVLVTGDHANLGRGIAGQVPRAGQMRRYPAPPSSPPVWNTTLVEGSDANATYDFDDQSDDVPQQIRYRKYWLFGGLPFRRRFRPHPLLCGPDGPIDLLPDHQHEGEAVAPVVAAGDPAWPTKAGYQPLPEVIAWGTIKDPAAQQHGQEIGVISAYDGHRADVGRIAADSTWHHWFDINLTGVGASPYDGFDATPAGQAALKKIDAYFLNCGVWLAPPDRQAAMRFAAWWAALWRDRIVELDPRASLYYLGEQAIDALGWRTSRCAVSQWVLDLPIFKEKIPHWEWPQRFEKLQLLDLPLEHYAAGGMLRRMMLEHGAQSGALAIPEAPPDDRVLEKTLAKGAEEGIEELAEQIAAETNLAARFMKTALAGSGGRSARRDAGEAHASRADGQEAR